MLYTKEQSAEARKKFNETLTTAQLAKLHSVLVIWIDPFGNVSFRTGYFDEYAEARIFAEDLANFYSKTFPDSYHVYINGSIL